MDLMDKKKILEKLCGELKFADPENFKYAMVIDSCLCNSCACTYDYLLFTIDDEANLILQEEIWLPVETGIQNNYCNYVLGEPNIKSIIFACNIFYNEGKGTDTKNGKDMVELLDNYTKFNNVKSARKI